MRNSFHLFLTFLTVIFLSLLATSTSAEPTKEQTVDYILERINEVNLKQSKAIIRTASKQIEFKVRHFQYADIKDCRLTVKETKFENDALVLENIFSVALSDLNPANVTVHDNLIVLYTSDDDLQVEMNARSRQDQEGQWRTDSDMTDEVRIVFSKGQGDKLSRAFSHLIKLCGGKEDLF